jgi:hypothetical protein
MHTLPISDSPRRGRAEDSGRTRRGVSGWIVCAGATRAISRGRVKCPRWGAVSAMECLACHLLVTVAPERDPRLACSTGA